MNFVVIHHAVPDHSTGTPLWITIVVGAAAVSGFLLSLFNHWLTQRRVRPIVICHEDRKRHIERDVADQGYWAASVHLTNESDAAAFNVRFGIDMAGVHIPWKHARTDEKASRLNVLRPNGRYPDKDNVAEDVAIDDRVTWHLSQLVETDVDEGRIYWAYYQGPAGDWWYTANPSDRTTDFIIKRVRSRHFGRITRGNRKLVESIEEGGQIRKQSWEELQEAAARHRARHLEQMAAQEADRTIEEAPHDPDDHRGDGSTTRP